MASPRDVHVDVTLRSDNPIDFTIEPNPKDSIPVNSKGELVFRNDHFPGFHIHFRLLDPKGFGYLFPKPRDVDRALFSRQGAGCPESGVWSAFKPIRVTPDRLTLVVKNRNSEEDKGEFGYVLRVTNDEGTSYLDLDPGGFNENGPME